MAIHPLPTAPRYSILCVDDEPKILESLALSLGRYYAVELAPSGRVALQMLKAMPSVNVIISDMRMPSMNGAQFLAAARRIVPNARRIVLTGDTAMKAALAAVNEGQVFRFLTKPCASSLLLEAVAAAIDDFEREAREMSAIRKTIIHDVLMQDPMTTLESRESLLERLHARSVNGPCDQPPCITLFIEIDINEEMSESDDVTTADRAMCILAARLQALIPDAECLARYRQTTFVALLGPQYSSASEAATLGAHLISKLEDPVIIADSVLIHRLRIGIATLPYGTGNPHTVLRQAEMAARNAKSGTQTAVSIFSPELSMKESRRREVVRALTLAVGKDQLTLHYQPIVDVGTHAIYSIEALARWKHSQLGVISPGDFIPLAEESGLIIQLGDWALNRACDDALKQPRAVFPRVSVNVSVAQVLHPRFLSMLSEALERSGLPWSALEIEITETLCASDFDKACSVLSEIRMLGIRVAIDDFGVGYSSLSYLNRLPADVLKIDASFARDIDRGGEMIIVAALGVAEKLKMEVILEGIETESTMEKARRLGISIMQGYYFAKPMPVESLLAWQDQFAGQMSRRRVRTPVAEAGCYGSR